MKNGMDFEDQKNARQLVSYGWTPEQISRQMKVNLDVIEAWMPHLTEEGWAAYRAKEQKDRSAATRIGENISAAEAKAQAREQILTEERIRAEVRAEMAADSQPVQATYVEKETQSPEAQADGTQENESEPVGDSTPQAVDTKRTASPRRRRKPAAVSD